MAATANLVIDQGSTFVTDIAIKGADGNSANLTNYTTCAKMAKGYASTRTRVEMTTSVVNPTGGIIRISLTADQTAALEAPARYVFDIEATSPDSTVSRVVEGIILVRPNVCIWL